MKKVFVALSTFAEHGEEPMKLLKESGFAYDINSFGRRIKREELLSLPKDIHGIIAGVEPYDEEVLDFFDNLECISRCGVGIDNISLEYAKQKNIQIKNTPEVVTQAVAELTLAMIFDLLRKLTIHTNLLKSQKWQKRSGNLLKGKNAGILGLGRIGRRVAEMLVGLGANVYGSDIFPDEEWAKQFGVKIVPRDQLLEESDILSLHLAYNKDNPFRLEHKEISRMKKGAIVINLARGQFINEDDLSDALITGKLSGAGIDVFSEEPYSGKLCDLENVVLTPHIATLTMESRLQMEIEATKNLISALKR